MRVALFALTFSISNFVLFAQETSLTYPDFTGQTLAQVLQNKNWHILTMKSGYLNSDYVEDFVVILQSGNHRFVSCTESADILSNEERIILVLTSNNTEPKVTIQNNKFIFRPDEGGMACYIEPGISIEGNKLTLVKPLVRGHDTYIFEYRDKSMFLISAESVGVSGGKIYSDSFDFIKDIIISEKGYIGSDSTETEIIPIKYKGFKKLSELEGMYSWEVAENKFL